MGKVSKWFRSLLSSKRPENFNVTTPNTDAKLTPSRRWSFSRCTTNRNHTPSPSIISALPQFELKDRDDQQHAIAAAEGWLSNVNREYQVAVKIQSHFRAYLARKALRALKGLVRLQALVRGHIVRKQILERLLQMQAALRARTRARALRAQIYESSQSAIKPSHINYLGPATPENSEHDIRRSRSSKHEQPVMPERNGSISNSWIVPDKEKMNFYYGTDEGSEDRVYTNSHSFTTSKDSTHRQAFLSQSSGEDQSLSPYNFTNNVDEASFCAAETGLQFISSKSSAFTRSGPFTPTRSNVTKSCQSGYSDYYPSYMSDTESSKAKVKSLSAPRQKTQLERSNIVKRSPIHVKFGNMKSSNMQNVHSTLHSNFISKAYPGSGRLDRLGTPLGCNGVGFSGGLISSY